jgi:hypothetical protein
MDPAEDGGAVELDTQIQRLELKVAVADGNVRYHLAAHRVNLGVELPAFETLIFRSRASRCRPVVRHTDPSTFSGRTVKVGSS